MKKSKKPIEIPARSWKMPSKWEVRLSGSDGSFHRLPATSYDDAKTKRTEALKGGRYYQGWIEEKR